jgi:hypothetical protein
MKRPTANQFPFAGVLLTLCLAVPAGAASIDEAGMTAQRGSRATHGPGILRMVTESTRIRPSFATVGGDAAVPEFVELALDHILTTRSADVFSSIASSSEGNALRLATIPQPVPSAEFLSAPGISSISVSVAGKKSVEPWNLVPEQSERFLQVAFGMMALGFVPTALRRSR